MKIDFENTASRAGFSALDLTVVKVQLFYGQAPTPPREDSESCAAPGAKEIDGGNAAFQMDLSQVNNTWVGSFFATPGHLAEIRLLVAGVQVTRDGKKHAARIRRSQP